MKGLGCYKGHLYFLWFYSISINKSSEIGITWTNLANYKLCALSSQAHTTSNKQFVPCSLSLYWTQYSWIFLCVFCSQSHCTLRGPCLTLSSCSPENRAWGFIPHQAWEGWWWVVIPLSCSSMETAQFSECYWRYWIQEELGEHCFFIIRISSMVGLVRWEAPIDSFSSEACVVYALGASGDLRALIQNSVSLPHWL